MIQFITVATWPRTFYPMHQGAKLATAFNRKIIKYTEGRASDRLRNIDLNMYLDKTNTIKQRSFWITMNVHSAMIISTTLFRKRNISVFCPFFKNNSPWEGLCYGDVSQSQAAKTSRLLWVDQRRPQRAVMTFYSIIKDTNQKLSVYCNGWAGRWLKVRTTFILDRGKPYDSPETIPVNSRNTEINFLSFSDI